jgi:aerobic C4-dicarboxylate transport protein
MQPSQTSPPIATERKSWYVRLFGNLALQVITAITAGVLLGHFYPATAVKMKDISDTFIMVIKVFIGPIVFLTITLGICAIGDLKKVGRVGVKALIYFEVVTTFALALGILVATVLKPGHINRTGLAIQDASTYAERAAKPFDLTGFLIANFTLPVLVVAIIAGIVLTYSRRREKAVEFLTKASAISYKWLRVVMYLAPVGAFAGMAYAVGKFGLATLLPLGKLMLCIYITMFLFVVIVLGSLLRYYKLSIWKFLKYIKEELLIVFATSSSEPALPSLMDKLEKLGCSKPVVGLVVPAGYSFNLDGTSIYLSMAVLFIAQLFNVELSLVEMLSILGILMITSKGAAGVTGSGFVILASTLTAIDRIPVEGLAFLLGVDKFMSEARAITNLIGNGVATVVISKNEKEFTEPTN